MAIDNVINEMNKKMKLGHLQLGVDFRDVTKVPFSSPRLNYMLHGGLPLGRVCEFSGSEGSGKTTTALDMLAQCQKLFPEKSVMYIDVEHTFDGNWASINRVDIDSILYFDPESASAESIFNTAYKVIDTGEVSLCVIDSIGAMVSDESTQKEIGDRTYGGVSRALTDFSNRITPVLARTDTILIGINQLRDVMNSPYGGTRTIGGKAWKHACTTRLEFRKGSYIDESGNAVSRAVENPSGNLVMVELVKSKVCAPDRKVGSYTLRYLTGIDYVSDLVDIAIKEDVIVQKGAWFYVLDDESLKFQGKPKLIAFLKENEDVYKRVYENLHLTD